VRDESKKRFRRIAAAMKTTFIVKENVRLSKPLLKLKIT